MNLVRMEEVSRSEDSSRVVVKSRNASGCLIVRKAVDGMTKSGVGNNANKRQRIADQVHSEFGKGQREYFGGRSDFVWNDEEGYRKRQRSEFLEYGDGRLGGGMYGDVAVRHGGPAQLPVRGDSGVEDVDAIRYRRRHSSYIDEAADEDDIQYNYSGDKSGFSNGSRFQLPRTSGTVNLTPREEYIRIQGKNGVLRVKVNKIKGNSFLKASGNVGQDVRRESVKEDLTRRNEIVVRPTSFVEDIQVPQERAVVLGLARIDKHIPKTRLPMPAIRNKASDMSLTDSGTSLKLGMTKIKDQNYYGSATRDGKNSPKDEMGLLLGTKEGKCKGGNVKMKQNLQSLPAKWDNGCDSQSDNGALSLKLESSSAGNVKFDESGKSEEHRATPLISSKDGKQKRGSGTEKQKLRDHIRKMLLDSGWTIDYRPRRNRDYQDSVYVSPSGTAYWSIVKAYEGLQKQFVEDSCKPEPVADGSQFSPVAEDVLRKLTRQTKKKMENEMKKKSQNGEGSGNLGNILSKKHAKVKRVAEHAASIKAKGLHSLINVNHTLLDDTSDENFNSSPSNSPPRISVIIGKKDKDISNLEGSNEPDHANALINQDTNEADDICNASHNENDDKATRITSYVSESPSD